MAQELRHLLADLEDTREIVLGELDARASRARGPLFGAWRAAQSQARHAYAAWREFPGPAAYVAYLAAQDRADAAQDALVSFSRSRLAA